MTRYTATIELEMTRTDDDLRPMTMAEVETVATKEANRIAAEREDVVNGVVTNISRDEPEDD